MTNMLATGSEWLTAQMKAHASSSVVYARGALSVSVDAVFGESDYEQEDASGAGVLRFSEREFIIDRADLVLDDDYVLPEDGDTITVVEDSVTLVYGVKASVRGDAPFRFTTPQRDQLRVFTKLRSPQAPSPEVPVGSGGGDTP